MTRCSRCGLELGEWTDSTKCSAHEEDNSSGVIDCRNRELANLRSLLRSVTGKLEEAGEALSPPDDPAGAITARQLIDEVLEALS